MNTIPLRCFKYRSVASAIRCLQEGTLYFAAPDELNDTLEVKFDSAPSIDSARLFREAINEVAAKHGESHQEVMTPPTEELISIVGNEDARFQSFTKTMGIFSASKKPDDQAMWAYYADNMKGVCFELEWGKQVLDKHGLVARDVIYSDFPRLFSRATFFKNCLLQLSQENPNIDGEELRNLTLDEDYRRCWGINCASAVASIKHTDWQHEQEIRLLSAKSGAKPILAETLKRVHFVKASGEDWGECMRIIYQNYPSVEVMQWEFNHGKLSKIARPMEFKLVKI